MLYVAISERDCVMDREQLQAQRRKFSQLRQSLRALSNEVNKLIEVFFSDRPLIKGSVYELKSKCGKPKCRCAQGEFHNRMVISTREKGKTKLGAIPRGYLVEVQIKAQRYQQLRRARARLVELHKRMLAIIDEMEAMRREQIPKSGQKVS